MVVEILNFSIIGPSSSSNKKDVSEKTIFDIVDEDKDGYYNPNLK